MTMSTRKFYKTIVHFEILSEEPIACVSLKQIDYCTTEGEWSGQFLDSTHETLDATQAASALLMQGSDPEFFQLNDDGSDMDDAS